MNIPTPPRPPYHCSLTPIRRHLGENAVERIAYVTGATLTDPWTGWTFSRRKGDVLSVVRFGAAGLPDEAVAGAFETSEKLEKAVVAREVIFAIPVCVPLAMKRKILVEAASWVHEELGVVVFGGLHAPPRRGVGNWHGHLVCSPRVWDPNGNAFGAKTRSLDVHRTGRRIIRRLRRKIAAIINKYLPAALHVSASRKRNGSIPRKHLGAAAHRLEILGIKTVRGNYNRLVDKLDRLERRIRELTRAIAEEKRQSLSVAFANLEPSAPPASTACDHAPASEQHDAVRTPSDEEFSHESIAAKDQLVAPNGLSLPAAETSDGHPERSNCGAEKLSALEEDLAPISKSSLIAPVASLQQQIENSKPQSVALGEEVVERLRSRPSHRDAAEKAAEQVAADEPRVSDRTPTLNEWDAGLAPIPKKSLLAAVPQLEAKPNHVGKSAVNAKQSTEDCSPAALSEEDASEVLERVTKSQLMDCKSTHGPDRPAEAPSHG